MYSYIEDTVQSNTIGLSSEQKKRIKELGGGFKDLLESNALQSYITEHKEHRSYFNQKLSSENIDKLDEKGFIELCKNLWASKNWTNKDWNIQNHLLGPNGFDKIKNELKNLLYGSQDIASRYDKFRQNIKGFGVAYLSEILNMVLPDKYPLWNDTHRKAIPFLKLDTQLPPKFFNKPGVSTGGEYYECLLLLTEVKNELTEFGIKDFIDLDVFLWYIHENVIPVEEQAKTGYKKIRNDRDHQIAVWVVRAGRNGEQENAALHNSIITIGWNELDDLSNLQE